MNHLYGVIGDPIAHSMSPVMHQAALDDAGLEGTYMKFHVTPDALPQAIGGIRALGIRGVNITVPHKVAVMELLDRIDPLAEAIGAVNTIVNDDGVLTGYNTDGPGYVEGLQKALVGDVTNKSVLMLGAGGAAKAIFYSLASIGVTHIDIANRTEARAADMIAACPFAISSSYIPMDEAGEAVNRYDIIIQTTSIGMSPEVGHSPLAFDSVKDGSLFSDIIYNPLETAIMKRARELGAQTQNGLEMFVHQGALAFEKWTGVIPDTETMKKIVLKQLGGQHVNR
ncbi:shikimate dehydrogenase [Rossellomorea sp. FS2]|uniref:shikimate dehydrogenase n=1 Tax=Rossellomorea sp. FS2 TaxID=3391447 RepID=UPI003A4D931D